MKSKRLARWSALAAAWPPGRVRPLGRVTGPAPAASSHPSYAVSLSTEGAWVRVVAVPVLIGSRSR